MKLKIIKLRFFFYFCKMEDSMKHKGMRKRLLQQLATKGITDQNILDAMNRVPRHFFLPKGFDERAYQDNAFPIKAEQTISQPFTVAFQTSLLEVKKDDKILEIGTGSGYQTAILMELCSNVFSIERQKILFTEAGILLKKMNYNPKLFYGDGYKGLPAYSPFDKILLTAGATFIPDDLLEQLKPGGIIVAPVGDAKQQKMLKIEKKLNGETTVKDFGNFVFVPFLEGKN